MKEQNTWTEDQQIQYELARDVLSSYSGLLRRVTYQMDDREEIEKISIRASKITQEKKYFNGFDDEKVAHVINVYSSLMKQFKVDYTSEALAAKTGLLSKYLETKAFDDE